MSYAWQKIAVPDETILERISEADIAMWMAAKLAELAQNPKVPVHSLGFGMSCEKAGMREQRFWGSWTTHAAGKCAGTWDTVDACVRDLAIQLGAHVASEAQQKRAAAQRLMEEAAQLEAVAQANKTNRRERAITREDEV